MLVIFYFWISELLFCINKIKWNEQYKLYNSINSIKKSMKRIFRYKYCFFQKKILFFIFIYFRQVGNEVQIQTGIKIFYFQQGKKI